MTMARARLVDPSVTRWYHCLTRCVRRAFLLGQNLMETELEELDGKNFMDRHRSLDCSVGTW